MSLTAPTKSDKSTQKVQAIFSSIADNYDRANRAITLGMDKSWRKKLVKWSKSPQSTRILDCATGTGALAFEFQKQLGSAQQIIGVDFCESMLKKACQQSQQAVFTQKSSDGLRSDIRFQKADIHQLPFLDNSFDISAIAYGLRNVVDPVPVLKEMARVTRSGGQVMILETGDKPFWPLSPFFYLYFKHIMPFVGGWVTGQKKAYQYLQQSSGSFPSRGQFLNVLKATGCFSSCEYKTLFFGASFIYKAMVGTDTSATSIESGK